MSEALPVAGAAEDGGAGDLKESRAVAAERRRQDSAALAEQRARQAEQESEERAAQVRQRQAEAEESLATMARQGERPAVQQTEQRDAFRVGTRRVESDTRGDGGRDDISGEIQGADARYETPTQRQLEEDSINGAVPLPRPEESSSLWQRALPGVGRLGLFIAGNYLTKNIMDMVLPPWAPPKGAGGGRGGGGGGHGGMVAPPRHWFTEAMREWVPLAASAGTVYLGNAVNRINGPSPRPLLPPPPPLHDEDATRHP